MLKLMDQKVNFNLLKDERHILNVHFLLLNNKKKQIKIYHIMKDQMAYGLHYIFQIQVIFQLLRLIKTKNIIYKIY